MQPSIEPSAPAASEPSARPPPGAIPGPPRHRKREFLRKLRSMQALARDPLGFVSDRFATYGDLYHVEDGAHLVVTRNPDVIREVLVANASAFRKRGGANDRLVPVLGDGLLTADGETWREQRRKIQPAFRQAAIASYGRTMVEHAREVSWPDGGEIELGGELMRLTLRIVCKALFDHDVGGDTDAVGATMEALRDGTQVELVPSWLPTPRKLRLRRAARALEPMIAQMVEQRKRDGLRSDLLSMLIAAEMSPRALRDELVTLFLAGHETTSHALTWALVLLSQHPDAADRLSAELAEVLGDREPELGDLDRLQFTGHVIDEAMRLYPPAYVVARVADSDTTLGGHPIPAGWQVTCWIWHCHHDPRWFADPTVFRPERFAERAFPEHAYLPFGGGTRMCIGAGFARMELRLLLASLFRRYRLRLVGEAPRPKPRVTLAPDGPVRMRVEHR